MSSAATTLNGTCAVLESYDPFSEEFLQNPYPTWERVQKDHAIFYAPVIDHYVVTRFDDVVKVLLDEENFSASNSASPLMPLRGEAADILNAGYPRKPTLNNSDPPRHQPMRMAVGTCMGVPRWRKHEPIVAATAERMVGNLKGKGTVDLVADLTFPLPGYVGFSLVGVPQEDSEMLKTWCGQRMQLTYGNVPQKDQVFFAHEVVKFWKYVDNLVSIKLDQPGDDLTSDLIAYARRKPEHVNIEDINNIIYSICLAAHESTTNTMGNCLHMLLRNRPAWERMIENPELIGENIEELIRFCPATVAKRRLTTRAVEIAGVEVPAGSHIMLLFGAANRDPNHFDDPQHFQLGRPNAADQVTFGGPSRHRCLGAPLARMELKKVLELLTQQLPDMTLASGEPVSFSPIVTHRGPTSLMVTLN